MTRPSRTRPPRPTRTGVARAGAARATAPTAGPRDLYVGGPATTAELGAELRALGRAPDKLAGRAPTDAVWPVAPGALVDPAFARQVYPRAHERRGAGPNDLAAAILDGLDPGVSLAAGEIDVATPELARRGSHALEEHPLTSAAVELADALRKKVEGRRAKHGGPPPSGHVLRVILVDAWRAWASAQPRQDGPKLLAWPARFPGGRALDEHAKDAPSSAHRKLEEALLWLEEGPGADDIVVDLGAAPGGWSWVALQRGARVMAVDRADLDNHVARHERLTHVRADAFTWVPERQPTWLLCDVITEPQRSLELARKALSSSALRGLVVTLKLKKPVDLDVVAKARATAMRTPGWFGRCKQLGANKLEVTLMMRRA